MCLTPGTAHQHLDVHALARQQHREATKDPVCVNEAPVGVVHQPGLEVAPRGEGKALRVGAAQRGEVGHVGDRQGGVGGRVGHQVGVEVIAGEVGAACKARQPVAQRRPTHTAGTAVERCI